MGGLGSRRWNWVATKDTVEHHRSIDISRLNRAGSLQPGYWGSWQWMRDGETVGSVGLRTDANRIILSYRTEQHGGAGREIEQATPIVWTPCRFGGARPYFVCPGMVNGIACSRRVTKLYAAGSYFLCRHCYRLTYSSQREDRYDRALRRANNIRERLGGELGVASILPDRPKGMHQRNYQRLRSQILRAEMAADERLAIFVERLQRSDRRIAARPRKEFWA
jgi:hypothetical protein